MDFGRLEEFIVDKMSRTGIPGLSIALVGRGEVVYARGFGFRDLERGLPATPGTVYGIGSVTKSFTALAVLKLAEEGKLSLEDPAEKYVPLTLNKMGEVTIHHLLTHTSGVPAMGYAEAFIRSSLGLGGLWLPLATEEDLMAFMRGASDWAVAKPGEKFFYLNEGYALLGRVVSKVAGVPYEEYVKKEVLEPLGMKRSYFFAEEVERDPDVAVPYVIDREGRKLRSRFPYGLTADGGLLSCATDLTRYLMMFLNRGELDGVKIAERKTIEAMEGRYARLPRQLFGDEAYGYGFITTERFLSRKLVWHSGSVLVYTAFLGYLPEEGVGVVVLANASGYPLSHIGFYALALALGKESEKELEFLARERILEKLEGVYECYKSTVCYVVEKQGDFLVMVYRDRAVEQQVVLVPEVVKEDYARFYTLQSGWRVWAEFFAHGDKVELVYERYRLVRKGSCSRATSTG